MNNLIINKGDKILVVAPHPDDEMLGCGGVLIKHAKQSDVLLITDGRYGFFENSSECQPEKVAEIRKKEFISVMGKLGVNRYICLDIHNESLTESIPKIKRFDIKEYTKIFIPGCRDGHKEHIQVNRILRTMIIKQWSGAQIYEYEVWNPMGTPNYIFDISDIIQQKMDIVSLYKSQIECYDYVNICRHLNGYRGHIHMTKYAEVYYRRMGVRDAVKVLYRRIKELF